MGAELLHADTETRESLIVPFLKHKSKVPDVMGSCLLLGKILSLNAFRGFEWTVIRVVYYANTYCYDTIYIWKVQELTTQLLTTI